MGRNIKCILALVAAGSAHTAAAAGKFRADDPVRADPTPLSVEKAEFRKIDPLYDFIVQSFRSQHKTPVSAGAVNTLGEVPDSTWFTNRHSLKRLSRQELQTGAGTGHVPTGPYTVVGLKTEGITPGFQMTDSRGRLYFVKPDPFTEPELATAADAIGARFFHALGYNTPENYIVFVKRSELSISGEATITGLSGKPRPMSRKDLDRVIAKMRARPDGSFRMIASYSLPGRFLGPFRYEGTRSDDPNDIVPHELRRDLRALHVLCAWLNHTDAKAGNSGDTLVEENGIRFIKHYLIDFGAILGSDSDMPKNARFGNEYVMPSAHEALKDMFTFGFRSPAWQRASYPRQKAIGRFEADLFDPEYWKANYPNPAHLSRQPDDDYWAAKQVMAFTDDDIRAIVETGKYSDPQVTEYIVRALIRRRDKIGRTYFSKVFALDHFRITDGTLQFEDLEVKHKFVPGRKYAIRWSSFNNAKNSESPLTGEESFRVPGKVPHSNEAEYYSALITEAGRPSTKVRVYVRKNGTGTEVVGVDRQAFTEPRP